MATQKPSIPKGTRDFLPSEMVRRNHIFETIRKIFQLYGFQPIETPAMENLSSLLGKYGEEGDKLLFRILNSGDFLDSADLNSTTSSKELALKISEKGLRYDLTVPVARFVVQHQNELVFPFKRYQIQPVWRADRPQKGRYREFFQCDVDAIGSDSLLYEAELVQIIDDVFKTLGIKVVIKLNNRKILAGISETLGDIAKLTDLTVALDKTDKIGIDKVNEELIQKGFSKEAVDRLQPLLNLSGKIGEKLKVLNDFLRDSATGIRGLEEMKEVIDRLKSDNISNKFEFDLRLARGLNYYTGTIIEVKVSGVEMGSVCGGGRYDNLTGIFGLPGVSGVGISFGADRIYDVMNELDLFQKDLTSTTRALFVNFGLKEEQYCSSLLKEIRNAGFAAEIYPDPVKLKKQLDYANRKEIPFVILAGENEIKSGSITVKVMETGEQKEMTLPDFINALRSHTKI